MRLFIVPALSRKKCGADACRRTVQLSGWLWATFRPLTGSGSFGVRHAPAVRLFVGVPYAVVPGAKQDPRQEDPYANHYGIAHQRVSHAGITQPIKLRVPVLAEAVSVDSSRGNQTSIQRFTSTDAVLTYRCFFL